MIEVQSSAGLILSACAAQDRGDRAVQEDRVALLSSPSAPRCVLAVLADGVGGGGSDGALAAENVLLTARQHFERFDPSRESGTAYLAHLAQELNVVIGLSATTAGSRAHSTLAAVLVQPHRIDWCHVGDSRIYHVRDHRIAHCTADHTLQRQLVEERGLSADRASLHPQAGRLVRALGIGETVQPDLGGVDAPRDGDTLLLCSDGLWQWFHAGEMVLLMAQLPPRAAAAELIARARARAAGQGDNCSLILLKLSAAPSAPPRRSPSARTPAPRIAAGAASALKGPAASTRPSAWAARSPEAAA